MAGGSKVCVSTDPNELGLMRDYVAIVKRNLLSPIAVAIYLLAGSLLYVREYRDAWFISVVITVNALIGIIQELRAKRALRKLELMSAPKARVIRGGEVVEVDYAEVAVGDAVVLEAGDEIPVDGKVVASKGLEVDESMLTGESVAIEKVRDDLIYAATTVVSGAAEVQVLAVGDETKAGAISRVLKRYKPELTPLQKAIQKSISWMTFGAIGLAVLIFVVYRVMDMDSVVILKTITAGAVVVVPEGLLLASSLLLAFGGLKLAQAKVLPQKLSAIEAMALLDLLCVDKTGTLTSDKIELNRLEVLGRGDDEELGELASLVAKEASGNNATGRAIASSLKVPVSYEVMDVLAFSSERKLSAVRAKIDGKVRTVFMGAPEYMTRVVDIDKKYLTKMQKWTADGGRVLLVAEVRDDKTPLRKIEGAKSVGQAALVLTNPLREGVRTTVEFLQKQGVSLRVISGDNPETVKFIAGQAGIDNPDEAITGDDLAKLKKSDFEKAADKHTIFARVLPEQKERLIGYFSRRRKLFTGMVGDGVNDALALKKADLGVAMYAGAPVSRRVSDIILLNNSFTALPLGMKLGNRIMQAIEMIATLFFHKVIYGVVLMLATMMVGMKYPFLPRHITFMNMFLVTMPTLIWTMIPPIPRHRVNPRRFWRDTLLAIAPIAVITGLTVAFTYWILSVVYVTRPEHVVTMTVLVATFFGVYMVFIVAHMMGVLLNKAAKQARLLYLALVIFVTVTSFGFGFMRDFFDFSAPTVWILWPAVGVIALAAEVQWQLARRARQKFKELSY